MHSDARCRLDKVLAAHLPDLTRNRIQNLISTGYVTLSGLIVRESSYRVNAGDVILLSVPNPVAPRPQAEHILLDIAYEDNDIIVINKTADMVVHPAPGNMSGTLVNALIAHCGESLSGIGGERRPGIVHRLDKGTSGLLVVAKNDLAHQKLAHQFAMRGQNGYLKRSYTALVWGVPTQHSGTIKASLGRSPSDRLKQAVLRHGGREAITHFDIIEEFCDKNGMPIAALLACHLETGRTHQIRVHMAHVGHPLLCDPLYSKGFETKISRLSDKTSRTLSMVKRQALHAGELIFIHPLTQKPMKIEASLPDDLDDLVKAFRQDKILSC